MVLWDECPDCKGSGGHWDFYNRNNPSTWKQLWVPCEPCQGLGRVDTSERKLRLPVDDIEAECTRG